MLDNDSWRFMFRGDLCMLKWFLILWQHLIDFDMIEFDGKYISASIVKWEPIWLLIIKVWGTSSLGFTDENMDRKRMLRMKNQSIAKPKRSKIEYLVNWVMTLNNVSFHRKQCLLNYIEISALYKRDYIVYQGDKH